MGYDMYKAVINKLQTHDADFSKEQIEKTIIKAVKRNMEVVEDPTTTPSLEDIVHTAAFQEENEKNLKSLKVQILKQRLLKKKTGSNLGGNNNNTNSKKNSNGKAG